MNKFVIAAFGFIFGVGTGSAISYFLTKNACEKRTQNCINEMKDFYEGRHVKENESELSFNDKPPISEFASVLSSNIDNTNKHTDYHIKRSNENTTDEEKVDQAIKAIKSKLIKKEDNNEENLKRYSVIDKGSYIAKMNAGYDDRDYRYVAEEEAWYDEASGAEVDIMDLPFDPGIIEWDELDQCYICDEHGHFVYMLEKVEE